MKCESARRVEPQPVRSFTEERRERERERERERNVMSIPSSPISRLT